MTKTQTHILSTLSAAVVCYFLGSLVYEPLFIFTRDLMEGMSGNQLSLNGPVPGTDLNTVRIVSGLIPVLLFGCYFLVRDHLKHGFLLSLVLLLVFFVLSYLALSFIEVIILLGKHEETGSLVSSELSKVRVGYMFLKSVLTSSAIVCFINAIINRWRNYKKELVVKS
jgi:hypothetical protein